MKLTSYSLLLLLAISSIFTSCEKLDLKVSVPDCVETKIKEIKKEKVYNPPAQVWKWEVDGNEYYLFTSDCCDQFDYLFDDNCDKVCAPSGGITGAGDGNCPTWTGAITKTLVWEDER